MLTPKLHLGLQGLGVSPCDVNFVGPLTEEQQAMCLAKIPTTVAQGAGDSAGITNAQLANIKYQDYLQGLADASSSQVSGETIALIGGALLLILLMTAGKR